MNKLKDKFESYTVSTMEEGQRATLLDNLARSVEIVGNDAENIMKETGVKAIDDQECVFELCSCLLSVLSHELKVIHVAEKPSFWFVAERISRKDTVKMIYRLGIRQSDSARCQVWIRHALIEGTIGSYLTLLEEDVKILKQSYKPTAFVRDTQKMESAKNLISNIMASVQFNIKLEYVSNDDKQGNSNKRHGSTSSADTFIKHSKGRGSPSNVVIIQDSFSSSYNNTNMDVSQKHLDTISLPGNFSPSSNIFHRTDEFAVQENESYSQEEFSPSKSSWQYLDSPVTDYFEGGKDEDSPKLIHKTLQKENSSATINSEHADISDSSDNSLCSSVDSLMAGCISKNNVIVNMIKVVSDDGVPKNSEDTLNVFVKDSSCVGDNNFLAQSADANHTTTLLKTDKTYYNESKYINDNSNENINRNQQNILCDIRSNFPSSLPGERENSRNSGTIPRQISEDTDNDLKSSNDNSLNNYKLKESEHAVTDVKSTNELAADQDALSSVKSEKACSSNENDVDKELDSSSNSSYPALNVCGSLTLSQNSAFNKIVKNSEDVIYGQGSSISTENDKVDLSEDASRTKTKVDQIMNVMNDHDRISENQNLEESSSPDSLKTEEKYRNQVNEFQQPVPLEGSSQLSNVLNNVSVPVNNHGDYFVPGIHSSSDMQSCESSQSQHVKNLDMDVSMSISIPSVAKNIAITDQNSSSPSTMSTISAKLFEKTLFSKTLGSSYSSDKGSNDGRILYSDSESDCSAGQSFSMLVDLGVSDDFIGMKEDHFSTPDTFMGFSSLEELENAITSCKQLISSAPEKSKRRDELVTHLVQLRLKLHELNDAEPSPKDGKKVLGHQFFKQGGSMSSTLECDACAATIFPLLQKVYVCKDCGFHCHGKCLNILEKPCVHSKKLNNATCELRICPEIPLSAQQYRCADCFKRIPMYDGQFEVRLCDYTGQKYCARCHWNDTCVIPARVVHNWDFSLYKVSRQSKHLLMLLAKKPDIKLQSINAVLFNFVDELRDVRTLRQQIMMMKKYIVSCRVATEERLLLLLQNRQHFVDNADVYSLQDLLDVHNNVLLNELSRVHATYGKHIKFDCLLCQGKGFICEFCNAEEIIFPFDNHVTGCVCKGTFHRQCYSQNSCPKCLRVKKKKSSDEM